VLYPHYQDQQMLSLLMLTSSVQRRPVTAALKTQSSDITVLPQGMKRDPRLDYQEPSRERFPDKIHHLSSDCRGLYATDRDFTTSTHHPVRSSIRGLNAPPPRFSSPRRLIFVGSEMQIPYWSEAALLTCTTSGGQREVAQRE
jgi:hypothetical protein